MATMKNSLLSSCSHKTKEMDFFCEACSILICQTCVSSSHKGHSVIQLSEVTPINKIKIKAFINEVEEKDIIKIQKELNSLEDSKLNDELESVIRNVENRGRKLRDNLDIFIKQTLFEMKRLKDENCKLGDNYKTELEMKMCQLKEKVKHCKESLQTGTDIQVFVSVNGLDNTVTLPRKPILGTAGFNPVNGSMEQIFGKVTLTQPSWSEASAQDSFPQHTSAESYYPPLPGYTAPQQASLPDVSSAPPHGSLLDTYPPSSSPPPYDDTVQTNVLPEPRSLLNISSVCPTKDGDVWTCYWKSDNLTRLTSQGEVKQNIQIPVVVKDICISPTTNNLWACSDKDNTVLELTSNTLTHRFKTKDEPKALCVIREDQVIIGTKHRITKHTSKGKITLTTKASLFSKPIVCSPQKISQCPITENIAVVDRDRSGEGGNDRPHIVVMNFDLEVLYRYGRPQHKSGTGSKLFNPWDIAYDRTGSLVVADGGNCCLHLLNSGGKYLRVLHTDTALPRAVGIGREEEGLWAVFGDRVKLVKCWRG
ncbi:uncharacterized protein LOC117327729 [Pecten maximus]|uniref:uncharacterized protein LOC117327729 n=1 Tax=Pecten maximus TaxID=6579 RepID=UPI001458D36F|nr:uncharacterized protein LOC117327729 [Pecten maximus]